MSKDITTTGGDAAVIKLADAILAEPVISTRLMAEIEINISHTEPGMPVITRQEFIDEAAQEIPAHERWCAPATPAMIDRWMERLLDGVNNPPEEVAFRGRVRAVHFALSDLPA